MLQQRRLARVVDQETVVAQPQARGEAVGFDAPVVHQVADLYTAGGRDEVGEHITATCPAPSSAGAASASTASIAVRKSSVRMCSV